MAKLKMNRFGIITLQSDGKALVEELQRLGIAELKATDDSRLSEMSVKESVAVYEKNIQTVSEALGILDKYAPSGKGGMFSGRTEISLSDYSTKLKSADAAFGNALDIISANRKIEDAQTELVRTDAAISSLEVWSGLDIGSSFSGTSETCAFIGSFPTEYDRAALLSAIAERLPEVGEVEVEVVSASKQQTCAFILCHKSVKEPVYAAIRALGFINVQDGSEVKPSERAEVLKKKRTELLEGSEKSTEKIKVLSENREQLNFLYDYLVIKRDEYKSLENARLSERTIIIEGYVPERSQKKLEKLCEKYTAAVEFYNPDENEDVPVLLRNSAFAEPVESITEMYALPGKEDVDPSPIMAFFYYLLFGMMLSDAGYGLIMAIGTAVILKKTKVEGNMRRMLKMFFCCGVSTTFWGVLFGSWFGDIIPVICTNFLGYETAPSLALWFEPIKDPIKLLLFSFVIGICHLFLGLITNGVMQWKKGDKASALCDTVPTMLLVLGAAPLAGGILTDIPAPLKNAAVYVALAGVVLIVLTSSRSSKNIIARLFGGIYGLYNTASGYLSDILSYSRLLALGLATGSIASVVNMIGVMPESKPMKAVMLIVVFCIGHPLNMAINVLGAYVHANRLQFVELFSKFYEGGGRAFEPLRINTKFYKFKEDSENE